MTHIEGRQMIVIFIGRLLAVPFAVIMLFVCMIATVLLGEVRGNKIAHWGLDVLDNLITNK